MGFCEDYICLDISNLDMLLRLLMSCTFIYEFVEFNLVLMYKGLKSLCD